MQDHLQQVAQSHVHLRFEYLWGGRLHDLPGSLVLSSSRKVFLRCLRSHCTGTHIKNLLLNLSLMRACQQLPHRLIIYLLMLTVAKHSWMGASRATRGRAENTALLQWNLRTCYDEMKLQEDQVMVISRSRTIRYFFPFSFLLKKRSIICSTSMYLMQ